MLPRDIQLYPIAAETTLIRYRTWDRLKFEIEYALGRGTTANSFIIKADKKVLIDPPGASFTDLFLGSFGDRFKLERVDYVILGHVNPNRAETLKKILEISPQIQIICSNPGAIALRSILEREDLNIRTIKGDESLDLGGGHRLEFILAPTPRWPDRLLTYDPKTEVLYTDKLFGCHVCGDRVLDEGWQAYLEDRRYYFDCLMAPASQQITTALDKISEFDVSLYATGHGPLVKYGLHELTNLYREWTQNQDRYSSSVALIYASAYGSTATIAQAIASGANKAGAKVLAINCEFASPQEIKEAIASSDGFIVGSPTLGGHAPTPVQTALGVILGTADKTKLAGVFGSFGWSGEAIDLLESKFKDGGYKFGFETIRVKFKPDATILKTCEEAGTDFVQALRKLKKAQRNPTPLSASSADRVEQAVGRIVGSMTIVTTKTEELSGAMLASWVSQATFNPPGLTIAVAKERAIESLMHRGNPFVLNILEQGKHIPLMKHFLKPFAPGEDRFVGVNTAESSSGCPILADSLAYLECTVVSRMECGDHWTIYATVENGKVHNPTGVTAVHQRKSGKHY
jgi:flavorubredoxin/flavin reductase (DIM6/NTAB) family NADH-FMN oxidoreductase RutF